MLAHTSNKLLRNINSSITFKKSIQHARFTLVTRVRVSLSQSYRLSSIKTQNSDKKPWKALFPGNIFKMVKQSYFEVLRKKSSNMARVVWAEESKNGLRFDIGPRYGSLPMRSQCPSDGQSSCNRSGTFLKKRVSVGNACAAKQAR